MPVSSSRRSFNFGGVAADASSVNAPRESGASLGGLCLGLASALVVVSTVWLLPATDADRRSAVWSVGVLAIASFLLWVSTLPARHRVALAGYPCLVFVALAYIGSNTQALGSIYVGLFTVSFVFVGLSMPRNTAVLFAPLAAVCWWACSSTQAVTSHSALVVRGVIALTIWVGVAELLAGRTRMARAESGRLRVAAGRDPLTGLNNRRSLDALLDAAEAGDALILLDLDHFKNVNDSHGHAMGDLVLTEFAHVVTDQLRARDTAIRYGGEEVLLHLPHTPLTHVGIVLSRLQEAWAAIAPLTTFSAGAAVVTEPGTGRDALLIADQKLYQAKANGRDQAVL
jgi:diguanylate cyclase (GGDEF)-like protein